MPKSTLVLFFMAVLLLSAFTGTLAVNSARANPIVNDIQVDSPIDGTIYNSTEVPLRFKLYPIPDINYTIPGDVYGHNYTSFSYSLDGHEFVETNGTTTLSGLTNGSHVLKIYGIIPFINGTVWYNNSVHPEIHFDVFYPTPRPEDFPTVQVVAISVAVAAVVVVSSLAYLKKRKPPLATPDSNPIQSKPLPDLLPNG